MLIIATKLHNQLPSDTPFPQIDVLSDGFTELCAIIAKYNVQNHFQLRLLHRHTTVSEGQILLGNSIAEPLGYWTTPTSILNVDLQNIHGHIFSLDASTNTLFPSEFRTGVPIDAGNINSKFFTEFIRCLQTRGLGNTLGLEVVQDQLGKMIEFSFECGNLLLKDDEVKAEAREQRGQFMLQETAWIITVKDGTVYTTGEKRCASYTTGHTQWIDSKIQGVLDIMKILKDKAIVAK